MELQMDTISDERIETLVLTAPILDADEHGERARAVFSDSPDAEGIVVMEQGRPVGIIMRTTFFQKMGTQYGYSLYMKRPIRILMDHDFMSADADESISRVGLRASSRSEDKLYDYLIVYRARRYLGVISIRHFFEELSRRNEAQISVLQAQQKRLLLANEEESRLRVQLQHQSNAVRNLLDHADQGFLSFGADLVIGQEVSYKCQEFFGQSVSGLSFLDVMAPHFAADRLQVFGPSLESYFNNNALLTDAVYLMLLPADCQVGERHLHLEYKRIEMGGKKAVMVVVSDVTQRIAMEKALEDDRYKQRLIIKFFGAEAQIRRMISEFRELFSAGYRSFLQGDILPPGGLDELFRAVHTYKGDFAQYGFAAADELHVLEDRLAALRDAGGMVTAAQLDEIFTGAENVLAGDLAVLSESLGANFLEKSEAVSIPRVRLEAMQQRLAGEDALTRVEAAALVRSLLCKPVSTWMEQYRDYVTYLSERMRKPMPIFLVEGDSVEVDGNQFDELFRSLVHIFRNCMDHGIEPEEERVQAGKTAQGVIRCQIADRGDGWFTLRISDDGCGISCEKLNARACDLGICTIEDSENFSREQSIDLIFADRLTTKNEISSLSGRGVGMSAVRAACRKLGGEIEAQSPPDGGTTFILTLPQLPTQTAERESTHA